MHLFRISVIALSIAVTGWVANAQTQSLQRGLPSTRQTVTVPLPPPPPPPRLPLPATARRLPPLPPPPASTRGGVRRPKSATGAWINIMMSGAQQSLCYPAGTNQSDNLTIGCELTWKAQQLPTNNTDTYQDYVLRPANGGAPVAIGASYVQNNDPNNEPENGTSGNGMEAGVFVFATLDVTTNVWAALAYVTVGPVGSLDTYNSGSLTPPVRTETFTTDTSGATTVYLGATGLNVQHQYAIGIEDQLTGRCVDTLPSSSQVPSTTLCKLAPANVTGTNPSSNAQFAGSWAVKIPTAPAAAGTFMATLYDQTSGGRVATRQFSIIDGRSSASTARVQLAFNGGGGAQTAYGATRIAWNGAYNAVKDPSLGGNVQIQLEGVGFPFNGGDHYQMVISDPTGTVVAGCSKGVNIAGNTSQINPQNCQLPPINQMPFELAFPGSTWLATIYDTTTNTLSAQQGFRVLGYSAQIQFSSPPGTALDIASGSMTTGLTYTNTGDATFGTGNGDPIVQFVSTTPVAGYPGQQLSDILMQPPGANSPCDPLVSATCTGTYFDSAGHGWNVSLACISQCSANNPNFVLTSVANNAAQALQPGASFTISGLTFVTSGSSSCSQLCAMATSIYPVDGFPGVGSGSSNNANNVLFTASTDTLLAYGTIALAGWRDSSGTFHNLQSEPGYTPNFNQAFLALNQPFTQSGDLLVFAYTIENEMSSNSHPNPQIQDIALTMPAGFDVTTAALDPTPSNPGGINIKPNDPCQHTTVPIHVQGVNLAVGASKTFYFDIAPPANAFSYTEVGSTVCADQDNNINFTVTPKNNNVATFASSLATTDSLSLAAYSLNGSLMVGQLSPSTIQTNLSTTLSYTMRNTPLSSDPFPDYADFVVLQIPAQTYFSVPTSCAAAGLTVNTPGWSCLAVTTGANTTFEFGLCASQAVGASVPASSGALGNDHMPACAGGEANALAPGQSLAVSLPVTTGSSATPAGSPVVITSWVHGANTDAWSNAISSNVAVATTASAGAGFAAINGSAVPQGTQPVVGGNLSQTTGNTYLYKIQNESNVAITSASIKIPGPDTTGANGADSSGTIWSVTSTPATVSLQVEGTSGNGGCAVTAIVNPANGNDTTGHIAIGNASGNTCSVAPGQTLDVTFTAKAPYKVNSTFDWPAIVNGSITTSPNWFADTQILIGLTATLSVAVNSAASCPPQVLLTNPQVLNFGNVNGNSTVTCPAAIIAKIATDASSPQTWQLYVAVDGNPARTASSGPANEILVQTNTSASTAPSSISCPGGGTCLTYDTTSFSVLSTAAGTAGNRVAYTSGSGTNPIYGTVNVYTDVQITTGTEPGAAHTQTITYTWIPN